MMVNNSATEGEVMSPPPLSGNSLLSDIKGIEHLYMHFDTVNRKHKFPGKLGECYRFAYAAASMNPELAYCEGLAIPNIKIPIPISHAWCVDLRTNEVIDPCWKGKKNRGLAYCGVPFRMRFVNDFLATSRYYGIIESLWQHKEFYSRKLCDIVHPNFIQKIL